VEKQGRNRQIRYKPAASSIVPRHHLSPRKLFNSVTNLNVKHTTVRDHFTATTERRVICEKLSMAQVLGLDRWK
jgi:hypothetical protein